MVEALCYKPEGRGFEIRMEPIHFFNLPKSSSPAMALQFFKFQTQDYQKMFLNGVGGGTRKADTMAAICEPTV
jgi:hypothetical protein